MKYGLYSDLDNNATKVIFKEKKIPAKNMIHIKNGQVLEHSLSEKDDCYIMSINRFMSVTQFYRFVILCQERGVSLHLINEPYLDVGNGKTLKRQMVSQIMQMIQIEYELKKHLGRHMRLTNEQWGVINRSIEIQNLEILSGIYSADGILKRR